MFPAYFSQILTATDMKLALVKLEWIFPFQGENQLIHSFCKSILSVEEILNILNTVGSVDNNIKKPFFFYLLEVYLKSPFQTSEIGSAMLTHDRQADILSYYKCVSFDLIIGAGLNNRLIILCNKR